MKNKIKTYDSGEKWITGYQNLFKDEADFEEWKDIIAKTDVCTKDGGRSFIECYMKYVQKYEEGFHLHDAGVRNKDIIYFHKLKPRIEDYNNHILK